MSESKSFIKSIRESAGMRLAVLFGSFFVLLIITSILSQGVNSLPGDPRTHALISSGLQCVLAFCIPAYLLSKFSSNNWKAWLKLSQPPKIKALVGVLIVYGLSMPAMEWLIEWNSNLHLPESMSGLERLFRGWEDASEATTKTLLDAHGFLPVLTGVLIIGVLTGFSEELFFRGGLQGIFTRSSLGTGTSVWLAAFIFSAMHFQFFGFLPRLLMGVFFGYLLVWTKSIWVPVFAHMLNNSTVVITAALTGDTTNNLMDATNTDIYFGGSLYVIASVILTALYLMVCRDWTFKTHKTHRSIWQKSQLPPVSGK